MSDPDGAGAGGAAGGGPGGAGLRRTPLHDEHVGLGATMTPFAGWSMPLRYAGELAEHTAVRTAAGLFDLSHMGQIRVGGAEAGALLDHALVGDLSGVGVGRARYTMMCADDGGVVDDLVAYRVGETDYLVVANAVNAGVVREGLAALAVGDRAGSDGPGEAGARFEATVVDASGATALVAVQGPAAVAVVGRLTDDPDAVVSLRRYACTPASVAGVPALVARTGYTGEDGFELFVAADGAPTLWRALLTTGASDGLVPVGLAARDTLRLEAGMPLYGNELDRTTTPHDAGLGRVVRLDKAGPDGAVLPFAGRAALARRAAAEPTRALVGLRGLGRRAARRGYRVLRSLDAPDDVVGEVTSGAPSPTLGHPIAMAYVVPDVAVEGTALAVDVRGRPEPVQVVPLPFLPPAGRRAGGPADRRARRPAGAAPGGTRPEESP